jgi:pilus assembly protein CpaF
MAMSAEWTPPSALPPDEIPRLRRWLTNQIAQGHGSTEGGADLAQTAERLLEDAYRRSGAELSESLREQLFHDVLNELVGFGPIQLLLDDSTITEVMVNSVGPVYLERDGKLVKSGIRFPDEESIVRLIDRIILPLGRHIDADSPTVDARLPDGSRVNAVIRPVAIDGPCLTIRKFAREQLTIDDLIRFGTITSGMARFLEACVVSRLNVVVSGGTGSGKTTLLNILSGFIPATERVVTIEDAAELQLHQEHVVRLETRPPSIEGRGEVPIRHLVRNALRMRPDRIIVGEVRGGEALDMLQAMNTGHDGSLTTVHANAPRQATSRLETLTLLAGVDLPMRVVREQITSAVDVIVQQARLRDGSRKVTSITEVLGMEGDTIVLSEVFKFKETGFDAEGRVVGEMIPTGIRPMFEPRLKAAGFELPPELYGANLVQRRPPQRRGR